MQAKTRFGWKERTKVLPSYLNRSKGLASLTLSWWLLTLTVTITVLSPVIAGLLHAEELGSRKSQSVSLKQTNEKYVR
jgi:hypothetical protein